MPACWTWLSSCVLLQACFSLADTKEMRWRGKNDCREGKYERRMMTVTVKEMNKHRSGSSHWTFFFFFGCILINNSEVVRALQKIKSCVFQVQDVWPQLVRRGLLLDLCCYSCAGGFILRCHYLRLHFLPSIWPWTFILITVSEEKLEDSLWLVAFFFLRAGEILVWFQLTGKRQKQ